MTPQDIPAVLCTMPVNTREALGSVAAMVVMGIYGGNQTQGAI